MCTECEIMFRGIEFQELVYISEIIPTVQEEP